MPFTLVSATFVYLSFSDRNLAVEGKAFLKETYRWEMKKIPAIIDGNHTRAYWDNACPQVYEMKTTWFRVEFLRLVEVFAVKIKPGKFEVSDFHGKNYHNYQLESIILFKQST